MSRVLCIEIGPAVIDNQESWGRPYFQRLIHLNCFIFSHIAHLNLMQTGTPQTQEWSGWTGNDPATITVSRRWFWICSTVLKVAVRFKWIKKEHSPPSALDGDNQIGMSQSCLDFFSHVVYLIDWKFSLSKPGGEFGWGSGVKNCWMSQRMSDSTVTLALVGQKRGHLKVIKANTMLCSYCSNPNFP